MNPFKPGDKVRRIKDPNGLFPIGTILTVTEVDTWGMKCVETDTWWSSLNFELVKEPEVTELPCIKIIPPVNIPERKEIQQGELYPYSFFQVQSGSTSQVYISMYSNGAWMSKDSLRKTAQAMNILANILEENEKDNG